MHSLGRASCSQRIRSVAADAIIRAPFATEVWVALSGGLAVTSGISICLNFWQHAKLEKGRFDEHSALSREAALDQREEIFKKSEKHFQTQMEIMAQKALISNNESFLNLAKHTFGDMQSNASREMDQKRTDISHIVGPLQKSLDEVGLKMDALEKERSHSFTDMRRQVVDLISSQKELRGETANLVKALRSPTGRGQWGELQLRRVIEMSGMVEHCDYDEQKAVDLPGGGSTRPDVVVKLSGNRRVVVDAKTPLHAYLEAYECADEGKKAALMKDHARHLRTHINSLSQKSYWAQFEVSPEFVILFIPGEAIFGAALQADPTLIEYGGKWIV
jgi:DNA recombination protein RmuC